ncbi:MAG: SpoIID/LytB domain-containing protein [Phycisphaerales bacterium]|nr:SpoIID/LytB domain-containing protein [Phycisphaerales bacterium]
MPIPDSEPTVRVRLERHTSSGSARDVGAAGQPLRVTAAGTTSQWDGPIQVSRSGAGWSVSGRGGPLPQAAIAAEAIEINPEPGVACALPGPNGQDLYPGRMRCVIDPDGGWLLLNVLPMEQYIPGVLQAELYAHWPQSTYEAQAIAARSYALMQVIQRKRHLWDVTDSASTQAYMGDASDQTAINAAGATRGQVLSFNGGLVPGYFCSCCGGFPATGTEAVGPNPLNAQAPLSGHAQPFKCKDAPVYAWTRTVNAAAVESALRDWGRSNKNEALAKIGEVVSITSAQTNDHGRATQLQVVDRSGGRATIDPVAMSSALFDLKDGPPMSGWFTAERDGDSLNLSGRGFGHGAGLCQYGAAAMGEASAEGPQIIRFYYPGASITTAW